MARQIRIEYAGATYHVMARGNHGQAIYADDKDRKLWLETLGEAAVGLRQPGPRVPKGVSPSYCRMLAHLQFFRQLATVEIAPEHCTRSLRGTQPILPLTERSVKPSFYNILHRRPKFARN